MTDGRADPGIRLGVDIGGTFTDFVLLRETEDGSRMETLKVSSTPDEPAAAVLEGLRRLGIGREDRVGMVHGSTVATNAVLEREGARTAFVATEGFKDLVAIGRQVRPELYDFFVDPPEPLVPAELRFEVEERVDRSGEVLRPLRGEQLSELVERLREGGAESVAACLLFSFLRPEHEERVAEVLRAEGFRVSASHEVLPEFREYERASTTVMDAYVTPIVDDYLAELDASLRGAELRIMQSGGGCVGVETARHSGVRSVLSGPAGGVVGAVHVASEAGCRHIISFDMGGTSTDVSLAVEGAPRVTSEARIGGLPIAVPLVDLETVGSGGGSIARVDAGGALRVGPRSAGADPGPACYGRGGREPTVTDANLVLGRLAPERFLGGEMELDPGAARGALTELAESAGMEAANGLTPAQVAALGVVRVVNARMERALRVISVERGHDPADFAIVSFGGAGGLHAAELARSLGVGQVLVPPDAATLSAHGALAADVVREFSRTVMLPGDVDRDRLEATFGPLVQQGREALRREGFSDGRTRLDRELDLRYVGQSYELTVPLVEGFVDRFHEQHRRIYGHADPSGALEIVSLRVRATGRMDPPYLPEAEPGNADPGEALLDRREVVLQRPTGGQGGGEGASEGELREGGAGLGGRPGEVVSEAVVESVPFYRAEDLRAGHRLEGPAVVVRSDTTVLLSSSDRAEVDRRFNLRLEVGR